MAKKKDEDNYKPDIPITNDIAAITEFSASDDKNPVDQLYEAIKKINEEDLPEIYRSLQTIEGQISSIQGTLSNHESRISALESRI